MIHKKIPFLVLILIFSLSGQAQDVPSWKMSLFKFMTSMVGEARAKKMLNMPDDEIKMPAIPKIENQATSTQVYDRAKEVDPPAYSKLSAEEKSKYDFSFLKELFFQVRNQNAVDKEISSLLNVLEQGGSREGVYRSLVLDQFYTVLCEQNDPSSEKLVNFVGEFMGQYMNLTSQKEVLLKTNFYWLKRYLVEKAMDIADLLSARPQDLHDWYALVSADLAKKFPAVWKGKTRGNEDAKWHKQWAQSVPLQHLKSELILKLHSVMNSLK